MASGSADASVRGRCCRGLDRRRRRPAHRARRLPSSAGPAPADAVVRSADDGTRRPNGVAGRDRGHQRQREPEAVRRRVGPASDLRRVDRAVADDERRDPDREHRRAEHREAVGHLGDHEHDRERRVGDAPEERHHRHDHERRRIDGHAGRDRLEQSPDAGAEQAADDHARARRCRRSRRSRSTATSRGSSRTAAPGRPTAGGRAASSGRARPGPSRSRCPRTPGRTRPRQPTARPAIAGRTARGIDQRRNQRGQAVEAADVQAADDARREPDQRVVGELPGIREPGPGDPAEDRREADDGAEDRERDDRGDEGRHERVRLDVLAVRDLDRQHGTAERGPEDRADPGAHARADGDPRIAGVEVQDAGEERAEPGADLGGRAFPTAGAARADRDRRGDELDERDPGADPTRAVVERRDRGVGAVALGLGREAGRR